MCLRPPLVHRRVYINTTLSKLSISSSEYHTTCPEALLSLRIIYCWVISKKCKIEEKKKIRNILRTNTTILASKKGPRSIKMEWKIWHVLTTSKWRRLKILGPWSLLIDYILFLVQYRQQDRKVFKYCGDEAPFPIYSFDGAIDIRIVAAHDSPGGVFQFEVFVRSTDFGLECP